MKPTAQDRTSSSSHHTAQDGARDSSENSHADTPLVIAGVSFPSRFLIGTGKFASLEVMRDALIRSEAALITMALRRITIDSPEDAFLEAIDNLGIQFLPNTAGARTAEEAIRIARLAKAASGNPWIKLEVTPNPKHLMPDPIETFLAAKTLVKEKFIVLPYIHADPVLAKRLEEVGCATVMPLGAPIGTNLGLRTRDQLETIIAEANIPVVIDAGIGSPSHAALAMELGADAVLVNTAIATAHNPPRMAEAFKIAIHAGREASLARLGPISSPQTAKASSPLPEFLG